MIKHLIITIALFFIYYNVAGLATTNILRLTAGNSLPVNSPKCVCDSCGERIPPVLQFPIISYIICRGRCRNCGAPIPIFPLIIETVIVSGMSLITALCNFSLTGVLLSFLFYEAVRLITVIIIGRRDTRFAYCYFIAVISMVPFALLAAFISALYRVV